MWSLAVLLLLAPLQEAPPVVREVRIEGLQHTDDAVARREISVTPGEALKETDPEESREQLEQVGVFRDIHIARVPLPDGRVDLQVDVEDRRGFGRRPVDLAYIAANLLRKRAVARYRNLAGSGVNLGAHYRFDQRRETELMVEWPRPLGLASHLTIEAMTGQQPYDTPAPTVLHQRGARLTFRSVLAPQATVDWSLGYRDRSFAGESVGAIGGDVLTADVGFETRVVDRERLQVHLESGVAHSQAVADGPTFGSLRAGLRSTWTPWPEAGAAGDLQPVQVALLMRAADAYGTVPLDGMFLPGSGTESRFPLRAHKVRRDGAIGRTPLGPSIFSVSNELRLRVLRSRRADLGLVPFLDVVRLQAMSGLWTTLADVGIGARLGLRGRLVLRADFAHSLSDGKNAWSFGLGQSF
jgi:hypothetical protein